MHIISQTFNVAFTIYFILIALTLLLVTFKHMVLLGSSWGRAFRFNPEQFAFIFKTGVLPSIKSYCKSQVQLFKHGFEY